MSTGRAPSRALSAYVRVLWVVGAVVLAAVILLLYALLRPYDYVVIEGEAKMLGPSTIHPGEAVVWTRETQCITGGVEITSQFWARLSSELNGQKFYTERLIPDIRFLNEQDACRTPAVSSVIIPDYLIPGEYILVIETTYKANIVRTVSLTTYSPKFTVIAKEPAR